MGKIKADKYNELFEDTDIHYLTKKEFEKKYHKKVEKWKQENGYRKSHSFILPVEISKNKNLFIVQTPWILQKEIYTISHTSDTQREILKKIGKEHNIRVLLKDLYDKKVVDNIEYLLDRMDLGVGRYNIENLINQTSEPGDPHEEQALKYYNNMLDAKSEYKSPYQINKMFFGSSFKDKYNQKTYDELIDSIYDKKINSYIVKASILYYTLKSNQFFKKGNYRTLILSLYSFFNISFFRDSLNAIAFFELFAQEQKYFDKAFLNTVEAEGDLTFIYLVFLKLFQNINNLAMKSTKDFMANDASEYTSLSKTEKNVTANQILLKYPTLSEKSAQFFATHREEGKYYTIKHFQQFVGCSYETARYSLDNLTNLKLYNKIKIGNKYVYKPN